MVYHYEIIGTNELEKLNRLISKGWRPVRETPFSPSSISGDSKSGSYALVLFERNGERPFVSQGADVSLERISDVPLLEGFSDDELKEFCDACEICSYEEGDVIFQEGKESRALHLVLEGEVMIRISGLPLEDMQIIEIGPGRVFGESTFFSSAPHTGSAECVEAVRTLKLDRQTYDEIIQSQTLWTYKLAENAAEILAANLQATDQWVWELLQESQNVEVTRSWHRFRERISGRRFGT